MSPSIDDITRLASQGASCAEIGLTLGVTKNAVAGKAFRAGVKLGALNGNHSPGVIGAAVLRQYTLSIGCAHSAEHERRRVEALRARYAKHRAEGKRAHLTRDEKVELLALSFIERKGERDDSYSPSSLRNWRRIPELRADAVALAAVIAAERAEAAERALREAQAELAAERAERTAHNAPILARRSEREREMARSWENGATLQMIGDAHGVSRERVRQILRRLQGLGARFGQPLKENIP